MGEFNLPGLRFWPTDEEVVKCYLRKKAMGEALPGSFMIERDLYGEKSPWEILMINNNIDYQLPWQTFKNRDKNDRIKTDATIYVVTPLKKAGRRGCDANRRNGRSAGCGAWHGENGQEIIDVAGGHVIGYKKMFIFEVQNESVAREIEMGSMIQYHWIMHEYTLNDDGCPFAICKLMVDDFKKVKIAPRSRIRKKSSGVRIHEEEEEEVVAAVAKEVIMVSDSDKIYDHEYYSRTSKRMREEEEDNNNHPQTRKKMHLLSEEVVFANTINHVLPIDHPVIIVPSPVQQSPSNTTTSGGDHDDRLLRMPSLLQLVEEKRFQEEPIIVQQQPATTTTTTSSDFLFDDDFGIDEYIDLYLDLDKLEESTEDHLQKLEEPGVTPLDHCHHHQEVPPPTLEFPPNKSTTTTTTNHTEDEFIEVPEADAGGYKARRLTYW